MFQQAAGRGGYRVCILDCAEDLNQNSANALLKLIEEPPPRSLFLIIAHRPGRVLATLRSRCQKILLRPLAAADIDAIVAALGPPWSSIDDATLAAAIARSHGSVHHALRLLDDQGIELDADLGRMLDDLPHIDWSQVHALADRITARNNSGDYETMLATIEDWLDARVRHGARTLQGACARRLAPYALVWEKLSRGGARDRNLQSRQAASCSVPFRRSGGGDTRLLLPETERSSRPSCGALREASRLQIDELPAPHFYITTAIPYANGAPHIGHAYERIATDAIARFKRLDGANVLFVTGMDEHGQKMQRTAAREGLTPQQLADRTAAQFDAMGTALWAPSR